MISKMEYLKKRYKEMSPAQLELIIVQLNKELEHNPDSFKDELCIAVDALEEKKKNSMKIGGAGRVFQAILNTS
jgi:hypothetical protein